MKLLVFAHTPPPHHGQSYMVQLMLGGFGGDQRKAGKGSAPGPGTAEGAGQAGAEVQGVECYHVDARLSQKLEDIGDFRVGKLLLLLGYCMQAIWCRLRYGVKNFYYIPAPGKRSALYRDWVVMFICRRFFKRVILHWHAAGLGKWLETSVQTRSRSLTYRVLKQVDLSIVLSRYNQADAEKLFSRQIRVVNNGIPDPCPEFQKEVLPRRAARFEARKSLFSGRPPVADLARTGADPQVIKVLYLAHCTREKGLFDTISGVIMANERLAEQNVPLTVRLMVTGNFVTKEEREVFESIASQIRLAKTVEYIGFVSGERKHELLREADLFCFPTFYQNENQPVNLIEAMAFGLPILTTRWRSIPELFPAGYGGLVDIRSPEQVGEVLLKLARTESGAGFRQIFLSDFTLARHLAGLAAAFQCVEEQTNPAQVPEPVRG
jgi:glycosyltransferase involved in cell wall biosynthesis